MIQLKLYWFQIVYFILKHPVQNEGIKYIIFNHYRIRIVVKVLIMDNLFKTKNKRILYLTGKSSNFHFKLSRTCIIVIIAGIWHYFLFYIEYRKEKVFPVFFSIYWDIQFLFISRYSLKVGCMCYFRPQNNHPASLIRNHIRWFRGAFNWASIVETH